MSTDQLSGTETVFFVVDEQPQHDISCKEVPTTLEQDLNSWSEPWSYQEPWQYEESTLDTSLPNFGDMLADGAMESPIQTDVDTETAIVDSDDTVHHVEHRECDDDASSRLTSSILRGSTISGTDTHSHHVATRIPSPPPTSNASVAARDLPSPPANPATAAPVHEMEPKPRTEVAASAPETNFVHINGRCVLACTNILANLERYILSELKALDLILQVIRKTTAELEKLIQLQQQPRSERCLILFTVIMSQIVELLEAGAKPLPAEVDHHTAGLDLAPLAPTLVPDIALGGAFMPTPEVYGMWRAQVVRQEFQHISEILRSVTVLARLGPGCTPLPPGVVDNRTKCLLQLEQKLRDICAREYSLDL